MKLMQIYYYFSSNSFFKFSIFCTLFFFFFFLKDPPPPDTSPLPLPAALPTSQIRIDRPHHPLPSPAAPGRPREYRESACQEKRPPSVDSAGPPQGRSSETAASPARAAGAR